MVIAANPAFGHARLLSSSPSPNAQLVEAPKALTLTFSESAQLGVLKLSASGRQIALQIDRGAQATSVITVNLPVLDPGTYEIEWSALAADDGHVTKGRFSFTVVGSEKKPQ
jgi:methionine-rich copper-binding protein CopC